MSPELVVQRSGMAPTRRRAVRPDVEAFEIRLVPSASAQGPFFLASNGALYAASDTLDGAVNTGGWGISLSVGKDQAGHAMAVIRDANSRVYVYDQGTWTDTGGYARDLVAGINGEFFARDFNNLLYRYQQGVGWSPLSVGTVAGVFVPVTVTAAGHVAPLDEFHAVQLALGQQTVTDPYTEQTQLENVLYYRNPDNHILVYRDAGAYSLSDHQYLPEYTDTGGFGLDIAAGSHGEAFVRDGNNRLYVYRDTGLGPFGGSNLLDSGTWQATPAWAFSLSVGQEADGSDFLAFKDANSRIYIYRTASDSFLDSGGYARQAVAGADEVFIRDFNDDVHDYDVATNTWLDLAHRASLIRVTSLPAGPAHPGDEVILLFGIDADPGQVGQAFLAGGDWHPLGISARDAAGYVGN